MKTAGDHPLSNVPKSRDSYEILSHRINEDGSTSFLVLRKSTWMQASEVADDIAQEYFNRKNIFDLPGSISNESAHLNALDSTLSETPPYPQSKPLTGFLTFGSLLATPFSSHVIFGSDGIKFETGEDTTERQLETSLAGDSSDSSSTCHFKNSLDDLFARTDTVEPIEVVDAHRARRVSKGREVEVTGQKKKESGTK